MKDCTLEEKDALMSIANKEQPDEFAKRYNITYANAVQKRRRIVQKIKDRLFSKDMRLVMDKKFITLNELHYVNSKGKSKNTKVQNFINNVLK